MNSRISRKTQKHVSAGFRWPHWDNTRRPRIWIIAQAWFLARLLVYLSSNISQILDFLYWLVWIFIFDGVTAKTQVLNLLTWANTWGKFIQKRHPATASRVKSWWLECEQLFLHILRGMYGKTIRSLSKDDGDVNKNGKKAIHWIGKTTTLYVHQAFLYISLPSLHDNVKMPKFTFCGRHEHKTMTFFFFFWNSIGSFKIQLHKKLPTFDELNKMD